MSLKPLGLSVVLGMAALVFVSCLPGAQNCPPTTMNFIPDLHFPNDEVDGKVSITTKVPTTVMLVQDQFVAACAVPNSWVVTNQSCFVRFPGGSYTAVVVTPGCSSNRLTRIKNAMIAEGCPSVYTYTCFETAPGTTFFGGQEILIQFDVSGPVDATGETLVCVGGATATDLDDLATPLGTYSSGRMKIKVRAPDSQRWLFTEFFLNGTRFVEVTNVSTAPQSVNGLGFLIADPSTCPSITPAGPGAQVNGAYVSSRTDIVPAGDTYVFMEGGTAGDPNLPGCSGLGERVGFTFSVSPTSGFEAALYEAAAVLSATEIAGDGIDYVRALPDANTPVVDGFRHRPVGPGAAWRDDGIDTGGAAALARNLVFNEYRDSDTRSDWLQLAAPGCGQPTSLPPLMPPANGAAVDLDFESQPGGFLSLSVKTTPAMIRSPLFNLISLQPTPCAGSGPAVGLALDVIPQALLPAGTQPFVVETDVDGEYSFQVGVAPPGLALEARSVCFMSGTVPVLSNFVYLTTQ